MADLYQKRWRIEEAFNTVKRLLGLSYLWVGSINGIKLQIWGTRLFYEGLSGSVSSAVYTPRAILIDLGDGVESRTFITI